MRLTIDPGIRGCGVSVSNGVLLSARYVRNPAAKGNGVAEVMRMARAVADWASPWAISTVVFEKMKIYPGRKKPGDPNITLLPLVGVAYALAGLYPDAAHAEYLPKEWKGSVDGISCTLQVRSRLTDDEMRRIALPDSACAECRKRLGAYCLNGEDGCGADHVYDAVGIALKHAGRFERHRVIPR